MKKNFLMNLSLLAIAVFLIGGSFAYLVASAGDANMMGVGEADIDQIEQQRGVNEDGTLVLEDFVQNKILFPGVYGEEENVLTPSQKVKINETEYMFWSNIENSIDKIVTVQNNCGVELYLRTVFAVQVFDDNETHMHLNFNLNDEKDSKVELIEGLAEIGGRKYQLYVYEYKDSLGVDAISAPSLLEVVLDKNVTMEEVKVLGGEYRIWVVSQVVQKNGFSDLAAAFNTVFQDVTSENHPFTAEEIIKIEERGQ